MQALRYPLQDNEQRQAYYPHELPDEAIAGMEQANFDHLQDD